MAEDARVRVALEEYKIQVAGGWAGEGGDRTCVVVLRLDEHPGVLGRVCAAQPPSRCSDGVLRGQLIAERPEPHAGELVARGRAAAFARFVAREPSRCEAQHGPASVQVCGWMGA